MKYRITSGRWDVPMSVYEEFEAANDEEARSKFNKISKLKGNSWDTMFLYRVDQVEKTTVLDTVRVKDTEGYANDF